MTVALALRLAPLAFGFPEVNATLNAASGVLLVAALILITVARAYLRQWPRHRRVAPPTFWLWLYVSVTGVAVYWMLYQVAPTMTPHVVAGPVVPGAPG